MADVKGARSNCDTFRVSGVSGYIDIRFLFLLAWV